KNKKLFSIFRKLIIGVAIFLLVALPAGAAFMLVPQEEPLPNPHLPSRSCLRGLQIALVLDQSGSMNGYLDDMETAFKGFVSSLLPGTSTKFSVTKFADSAQVRTSGMTSDVGAIHKALKVAPDT